MTDNPNWDAFISHAAEDKEAFVRPLAVALQSLGAGRVQLAASAIPNSDCRGLTVGTHSRDSCHEHAWRDVLIGRIFEPEVT